MERNSIKNNLTKEDIISDIVLSSGADVEKSHVYILVEGESDICLVSSYFTDNVFLYESYSGKEGVEYIVGEYFSEEDNVIGIRDRDYQLGAISEKIFYYDYGCMEMMLISNDEVFSNLCDEYYYGRMRFEELKKHIFKQLKFLSTIRLYNEREKLGILLKGVSINEAWEAEAMKLDCKAVLSKISKMNNGHLSKELQQKIKEEDKREWSDEEYLYNTQGHDFFMLFTVVCNQYRKKAIKSSEAEASARCSFRKSDMIKTSLYKSIIEYGRIKKLEVININA